MTRKSSSARHLRVQLAGGKRSTAARRLRAAAPGLELAAIGDSADFIMMPSADYERLLDEADERGALLAFERTRDEEFVPIALASRLLNQENHIRVWREHRGLTLAELSRRAGLSKGYLSDLERGKRNGTLATLRVVAEILQVELEDLVPPAPQRV